MTEEDRSGDSIRGRIGNVSGGGQAAVGKDIIQTHHTIEDGREVTEADRAQLAQMLESLRSQVVAEVSTDKREQALERVDELDEAVNAEEPDLTTMEYVRNWFGKHLPKLAGAVTSVVVNPIVGAVVAAAGEGLANEYRRRFGVEADQK